MATIKEQNDSTDSNLLQKVRDSVDPKFMM
jgi:hypothetical protein